MRKLEYTTQFERDFRRIKKNPSHKNFDGLVEAVVTNLQMDIVLDAKFRDHSLLGAYKDCRECHIKPVLLLIYSKPNQETLILIRLGSHSDLF